jgi:hypothetical protein
MGRCIPLRTVSACWQVTGQLDIYFITNVKVKCSLYRPSVAQRMGRGTRRGWAVSSTPRPHVTPGKDRYPFYNRLGGPQGRSGQAENLVPTGIRSRTVQPVAQSLYRLSYPTHIYFIIRLHFRTYRNSNTAMEGTQKDCIPMNASMISAHHAVSVLSSQHANISALPVSWCLSVADKEANTKSAISLRLTNSFQRVHGIRTT